MPQQEDLRGECGRQDVHTEDETTVDWNEDSPSHPRNWNIWSKFYTSAWVILIEFYMTMLSTAGSAASKSAYLEFEISSTLSVFAFVTVYLLGQAIGGVFCSPISEVFGRRTIYIVSAVSFGVASVIVAAPNHLAGVIVGRFFCGVAAAIPATVAFGGFQDMFDAEHRIWVVYAYTVWGFAGLAVGPIYSSYITTYLGWRWVFYISAMMAAGFTITALFIRESNAEQLLQAKAKHIQEKTGQKVQANIDQQQSDLEFQNFVTDHIYRPLRFMLTEPLVMFCSALCAIAFGLIYGFTESLTIVYTTPPFDNTFNETDSSLAFIAILIGEILDVLPRVYDAMILKRHRKCMIRIKPETKIRSFALACPALAIGLWIFAWTIPQRTPNVPWPISMIGLICVGFAANDFSYVLFGYITDSYGSYAASAVSSISTARTIAGAVFPLFTTQMYRGLGNNVATTIFAAVATAFCFTPILFLKYGAKLREKSQWATNTEDCLPDENYHLKEESSES